MAPSTATGPGRLGLDPLELSKCVACGLCLPHCPTFRVTGEEGLSPRGRIDAMRAVERRGAPVDDTFVHFIETCVQCRGCEPACPSGVPFGNLVATTRTALAAEHAVSARSQRAAFAVLGRHRLLLAGSSLLAVAQRLRLVPKRLGLARLPLRRGRLPEPTSDPADVWLFTGCVMDAWLRPTHRATAEVVAATGASLRFTPGSAGCCGALHAHAGLADQARALARRTMAAIPGDAPILVNSAGCGAAMKEYGHLLGTDEAAAFSRRVRDVHEWLAERVDRLPVSRRPVGPVVVQDPCHLRHVQRAHQPVRTVLGHYTELVELDDEGLCCGAGGAYSALQPALASAIRDRKVAAIERAAGAAHGAVVASANPGCAMHLAAAGLDVRHPMDLVAEAIAP
jgi:glycolate oxidase iron-sulfur subunit